MKKYFSIPLILVLFLGCPSGILDEDSNQSEPNNEIIERNNWCDGALGGSAHTRTVAAGLGRAHVGHRLFGALSDWLAADVSLSSMLESVTAYDRDLLKAYAENFPTVCALEVVERSNDETQMKIENGRAVIQPGTTIPELPADVAEIVIDMRGAPVDDNLMGIISLAFSESLSLGVRELNVFHGFPSQDDGWTHYETERVSENISLQGSGTQNIPLVFWTGPRLSPTAALWIGGLRLAGRAGIVGYDVYSHVAESTWTGNQEGGLLWRSTALQYDGIDWPDIIQADIESDEPEKDFLSADAIDLSLDVSGASTRGPLANYKRDLGEPDGLLSQGTMRAALLVAYGTLDWFYPFFDLVGRDIDPALETGLGEIDNVTDSDRKEMKKILGRFMHSIHDGHGFYSDWASDEWSDGYLDIQIQEIDGMPVVRTSSESDIQAGDTITAVDGVASEDWYEEATSRYSASSDWYRFVLATDELKEVYGSKALTLKNTEGVEREVTTQGTSWVDLPSVAWGGTLRESGWLTDMGEANIYYVNMAGAVTPDITETINNFDSYLNADGIILDMRDYPNLDIYEFARNFNPTNFTAPLFGFPTWTGADDFAIVNEVWSFDAGVHVYTGPVVLMVSAKSVSAAECFAQMLVPLENVTVVGQTSATTNGTITNAWLPGKYQITFTGMRLVNPDGSEFHGIGVVPDHVVAPTPVQFAAGEDPELQKALQVLTEP